jgi:acylpyruvate hydrolase
MSYIHYKHSGERHVGELRGDLIVPLKGIRQIDRTVSAEVLNAATRLEDEAVPVAEVEVLPASPAAGKIVCVGLNYKAHVDETGRDLPTYPVLFPKYASNLIGPTDDILLPPEAEAADYEGEMALVIGRAGRRISEAEALDYVLGYCVANDISMRDYQYKSHQWMQGKAWDDSTPLGPAIVTPDEVDPCTSTIRTVLNGEVVQESTLEHLIFSIPRLIATISEFTALEPGDVILTGTPSGIGYKREPRVILQPGDTVTVEVDGIGTITNRCVAEEV